MQSKHRAATTYNERHQHSEHEEDDDRRDVEVYVAGGRRLEVADPVEHWRDGEYTRDVRDDAEQQGDGGVGPCLLGQHNGRGYGGRHGEVDNHAGDKLGRVREANQVRQRDANGYSHKHDRYHTPDVPLDLPHRLQHLVRLECIHVIKTTR